MSRAQRGGLSLMILVVIAILIGIADIDILESTVFSVLGLLGMYSFTFSK